MSARVKLILLVFVLALSCAALAQQNGGASAAPKAPAAQSAAKAPAASANYDPHELTGIWNMAFPPGATQVELETYVSQFGKDVPPMTAWAKERFDKTKPAFGKRGVLVAQTNDPAFQCYPPGVPRIYLHPFPMQIVQPPKR